MSNFETNILKTKSADHILFWYRYMGDILIYFIDNQTDLQNTLIHLNQIHQKIKFTMKM